MAAAIHFYFQSAQSMPSKPPRQKQSNVQFAVSCCEECSCFYIGETKHLIKYKCMTQHFA